MRHTPQSSLVGASHLGRFWSAANCWSWSRS